MLKKDRIIDYFDQDAQEEISEAMKHANQLDAFSVITSIYECHEGYEALNNIWLNSNTNEQATNFAQDVIDLITGRAKFLKKFYYIRLLRTGNLYDKYFITQDIYHSYLKIGNGFEDDCTKTKFTMDEIRKLGYKYVPFAVSIDEVEK